MNYDVLIAGGGPAGLTAAIYSGRSGWKTVLLDPTGGGGQVASTDHIYNYPGFPEGVSGFQLSDLMLKQAASFGVQVIYDEVKGISKVNDVFHVQGADKGYRSSTVIYAAGSTSKKLGVPGEEEFLGKGISFCATCDGPLFRDKVVAVIGGGDSALTEAVFLAKFAKEVLVIHRRKEFRASMASYNLMIENPKIRVLTPKVVKEIKGEGSISSLIVEDLDKGSSEEVLVEGLFLYVGLTPNTLPIKDMVSLNQGGFVLANEDMTTGTEGLFVAGDIRDKPLRQVATAVSDGAVAAWSAERILLGSR